MKFPSNISVEGEVTVQDEVYSASWDGSLKVPTKNAIYDKIQTIISNVTHSGDVTGSTLLTIATNTVNNTKLADMAVNTFKGRITAGTGDPQDLTVAQMQTVLGVTTYTAGTGINITGTVISNKLTGLQYEIPVIDVNGNLVSSQNLKVDANGQLIVTASIGNPVTIAVFEQSQGTYNDAKVLINSTGGRAILSLRTNDIVTGTNDENNDLFIKLNGTERLRILKLTGNVGIGTSTPSEKLEVSGYTLSTGYKIPAGTSDMVLLGNGTTTSLAGISGGGGSGINNVVEDLTPQLGGTLDLNLFNITGNGTIDISGDVKTTSAGYFEKDTTSGKFIKISGTADQILLADGTVTSLAALGGTVPTNTFRGRVTAGTGAIQNLTTAQMKTALGYIQALSQDLVPTLAGNLNTGAFGVIGAGYVEVTGNVKGSSISTTNGTAEQILLANGTVLPKLEESFFGTAIYNGAMTGTVNLNISTFSSYYGVITGNVTIGVTAGLPAVGQTITKTFNFFPNSGTTITLPAHWKKAGAFKTTILNTMTVEFNNYPTVGVIVVATITEVS